MTKVRIFITVGLACILYDHISQEIHVVQQFILVIGWIRAKNSCSQQKWDLLCEMLTRCGQFHQFGPHADQVHNYGPFWMHCLCSDSKHPSYAKWGLRGIILARLGLGSPLHVHSAHFTHVRQQYYSRRHSRNPKVISHPRVISILDYLICFRFLASLATEMLTVIWGETHPKTSVTVGRLFH